MNYQIEYQLSMRGAYAARSHIRNGGKAFVMNPAKSHFGKGFNTFMFYYDESLQKDKAWFTSNKL